MQYEQVCLKESTSLWVEIPVGVRLPTAESPQTPRKQDPHWELLLLLLLGEKTEHEMNEPWVQRQVVS